MPRSSALVALATTVLAGCSLIPDYHRPALPVTSQWPSGPASTPAAGRAGAVPAADIGWRDFFTDPVTQRLIALSLANNRDLRVAGLNVAEAQAQYRSAHAGLFPAVNATGGFERSRTPGSIEGSPNNLHVREYSLGLGVTSWELDLFGRLRSQQRQAQETYLSEVDTRLSAQISLVAEVGSEYLTWLADRQALRVSQDTVKADQDSLHLTRLKASHGEATALDVAQAETTLHTAEASVAQSTRAVAQDMDALVLLVGAPLPDGLVRQMEAAGDLTTEPPFPALPAGLPSDLLERRPDIRAAEHTLLGANANIGAARAAFFPDISLTANGGTASSGLAGLFGAGSATWLFQPQISLPIFDAGRNQANLDLAKLEARADIADYEKAIQSAFRDVADALAARSTYVGQLAAEQALVESDSRFYRLSDMRFRAGIDTYLNVLVAQDALFSARLTLISLQLAAMQNAITLYKALGGGWQEHSARAKLEPAATAAR